MSLAIPSPRFESLGLFHGLEMSENGNHVVISFGVVLWLEPLTYTRYLINIDMF